LLSFINPKFAAVVTVFSAFVLTTSLLSQAAEAAEITEISWKGTAAEAYVSTEDDNDLHSEVYIAASDSAHRKDSNQPPSSVAYINVHQYQNEQVCDVDESGQQQCSNQFVNVLAFDGFALLGNSKAFEQEGLSRATLHAGISGFDSVSNATKNITIDAVWKGVGETSSENYVSNYHTTDYVFHGKASGLHRLAHIQGSISVGGGVSINLDPDSTDFNEGSLQDSKAGYIEITK
jgi:hypothetical protein